MPPKPALVFACAHLTDERLFAHQVAALSATHDCHVYAFRDHPTLGGMAVELLANAPPRFTLIGLSLGGYLAFEVLRRQRERIERLVLLDTRAVADTETLRQGRLADIAKVQAGGIDALIPELPGRWIHPSHRARLGDLMRSMARSIGDRGQFNQQQAMLARPDSHADLRTVSVPTLVACGREDTGTPLAEHERMRDCVPGARLEVFEQCGHLSTIEQPNVVTSALTSWLANT
ncbi:MAG TPA: alpha/beta fold hydrolase [Polyangiaceae bacterium]|nr:alpha/beta fold hydrolase [Polyangiaceae bacterium]